MKKCVHCNEKSLPGLVKGQGLCQKHWDTWQGWEPFKRTGETKEALAKQCAQRLLRGESPVAVEASLAVRGIYPTDEIMKLAEDMCRK